VFYRRRRFQLSVKRLSHFHEWLHICARQYCLTNSWDMTAKPFELAASMEKLEFLRKKSDGHLTRVLPGRSVRLFDVENNEEVDFKLVTPDESDPENAKISFLSPLGSKLLGCVANDTVEVRIFGRKEVFHVIRVGS